MGCRVADKKLHRIFAKNGDIQRKTLHLMKYSTLQIHKAEGQWKCSETTVILKKIQWFTTDHAPLYFLPVKVVILALFYIEFNFALNYMQILLVFTAFKNTTKNCKNGAKKL